MGAKQHARLRTSGPKPAVNLRLRGFLLALLAGLIVSVLNLLGLFKAPERLTYDMRLRLLSSQRVAHPDIILIEINDDSFTRMQESVGSWPWPRSLFAAVIQHASQARSITLDLLFSETDQHFIRGDKELAQETAEHGRVINSIYLNRSQGNPTLSEDLFTYAALPPNLELPPNLVHARSALVPFKSLLTSGSPLGHANNFPDADGVVRRNPLFIELQGRAIPSLALATALTNLQVSPREIQYVDRQLHYGPYRIPLDERGLLRFVPARKKDGRRYPTYNIADVLLSWNAVARGEHPVIPPETFKDRIVLVGSSAVGLYSDRKITPVDPLMPGIMVHASLIENLLTQTSVRVFPAPLLYVLTFLLALFPLIWKHSQRPGAVLAVGLLVLGLYGGVSVALLFAFEYMLPVAAPLNACLLSLVFMAGLYWRREWKNRGDLEKLEHAKQTFTDMLVHDLKGQVSSIMLAAEMMDRNIDGASATSENRMGRIIKSSGARLLTQVNALLDIRRMDEGKLRVNSQLIDLNAGLESVTKDYLTPAESIGGHLETDLDPQGVLARVDPDLFRRIIENLLWNAMYHGAQKEAITLRSRAVDGKARIAVLNHGRRIPEADQETLFQPFVTRALATEKNKAVGTGLGLTFCQMATEALGGKIAVYSPRRDGSNGAEFELTFNLESLTPVGSTLEVST